MDESVHASVHRDGQGLEWQSFAFVVIQDLLLSCPDSVRWHSPACPAQRIIGWHIGPAIWSLWRLKAQHRLVPGDTLMLFLPLPLWVIVLVAEQAAFRGEVVTAGAPCPQILGGILFNRPIGLSISRCQVHSEAG